MVYDNRLQNTAEIQDSIWLHMQPYYITPSDITVCAEA
jgi:hypothetical protein